MKTGGTNVLLDLRGGLHDCSIFLTMSCVTGQYSELPRAIVGSLSSTKEALGPRRLKLAWSQPMVTIVILGSVAVGACWPRQDTVFVKMKFSHSQIAGL